MSVPVRRERWRVTHARLIAKHRTGGGAMSRRLRVPVYRGGQGRPVEVAPTQNYEPLTWDSSEPRVQDLLAYQPKTQHDAWASHADVVRDLVLRTDYFDRLRDRHLAGTLHGILTWAERRGFSTDPASLLSGDRIDTFVQTAYALGSRSTHQWRLRHVAATVFPPPSETLAPRRLPMDPHTPAERDRFLAAAQTLIAGHHGDLKTRQSLHRDVIVVLALTFGAGCNGTAVHTVREEWLRHEDDGVWLDRPDRTVPTPIAEPWGSLLLDTCSGDPDAWLLRPQTPQARNEQVGKVFGRARKFAPALKGFDCDRAARRWHVDVLDKAHFADLAALLGYKPGSQTPVDLTRHLPSTEAADVRARVRGWVA